jgi:hypothetical protein
MKQTAPRVTPEHIDETVVAEYYINAGDALESTGKHPSLDLLTLCVLVMKNGFTIVGKSACVSAGNFDAALGRKIAREDAVDQIWALEGYLLASSLVK